MTPGRPLRRRPWPDVWVALAVCGLSLAVYLPTLSPSVVADDGGEFQMLASVLGVSHPTGYPLYLLLTSLFARLPLGGDAAFRVTLFGALAAAANAGLLYLTARELGAGRAASIAAALLMAAAPRMWMHAAAAEVHPLAASFILLGIWLLLRWGNGKTSLWVVALALGFGLTHHISLRLFGPAMLVYLLLVDARLLLRPRRWLPALACLLAPLALYAYVPLRAAHFAALPQWSGEILGVPKIVASGLVSPHYVGGGFWNLALALDYSGQFFGGRGAGVGAIAAEFFAMLRQQFPLAAFPFMALGSARWRGGSRRRTGCCCSRPRPSPHPGSGSWRRWARAATTSTRSICCWRSGSRPARMRRWRGWPAGPGRGPGCAGRSSPRSAPSPWSASPAATRTWSRCARPIGAGRSWRSRCRKTPRWWAIGT